MNQDNVQNLFPNLIIEIERVDTMDGYRFDGIALLYLLEPDKTPTSKIIVGRM